MEFEEHHVCLAKFFEIKRGNGGHCISWGANRVLNDYSPLTSPNDKIDNSQEFYGV
jgi:hypothetical protein